MRNKYGLSAKERINKDLEIAGMTENAEERKILAHMALSAAEFAIDFNLISYKEWCELTQRAFAIM